MALSPEVSTLGVAAITTFGGIFVAYITFIASKKNDKDGLFKRRRKNPIEKQRAEDRLTYAGYEKLIKELSEQIDRQNVIIDRMTNVDKDRDELIDALRKKEEALYRIIDEKNAIITKLKAQLPHIA